MVNNEKLNETEIRTIINLLRQTSLLMAQISRRMGVSKTAISAINERFGVRTRVGKKRNEWMVGERLIRVD